MNHEKSFFKVCPFCKKEWHTRDDFLDDKNVEVNGYQVNFLKLEEGLFYFTHLQEDCHSSFAIFAHQFSDLYDGPVYKEKQTGLKRCPEYCLHADQLDSCPNECNCAYIREILQLIRDWKKKD